MTDSWGFNRIQSPAARRLLRNLEINEVSSVDRGAGFGVKVLLLKRNGETERTEPMSALEQVAKGLSDVAMKRRTAFEVAQDHQRLAREDSMSLDQWYQTEIGKSALAGLAHTETVAKMTANACGDGYRAVQKSNPTASTIGTAGRAKPPVIPMLTATGIRKRRKIAAVPSAS
jgi:hypothetical protein